MRNVALRPLGVMLMLLSLAGSSLAQTATTADPIPAEKPRAVLGIEKAVALYIVVGMTSISDESAKGLKIRGKQKPVFTTLNIFALKALDNYLIQGIPLSGRLKATIRDLLGRYDLSTEKGFEKVAMTSLSRCCWIVYTEDGVYVEVEGEWEKPFRPGIATLELPKFRNGAIGIREGDIYVKDGTEAKMANKTYTFEAGKWLQQVQ